MSNRSGGRTLTPPIVKVAGLLNFVSDSTPAASIIRMPEVCPDIFIRPVNRGSTPPSVAPVSIIIMPGAPLISTFTRQDHPAPVERAPRTVPLLAALARVRRGAGARRSQIELHVMQINDGRKSAEQSRTDESIYSRRPFGFRGSNSLKDSEKQRNAFDLNVTQYPQTPPWHLLMYSFLPVTVVACPGLPLSLIPEPGRSRHPGKYRKQPNRCRGRTELYGHSPSQPRPKYWAGGA